MESSRNIPGYLETIRSRLSHRKILLVYASACVVDSDGQVLMQRRGDFGWWGLPGGLLEMGESLPECAVREVREETGLEVATVKLIGLYSSPDFDVTYPNGDQVQQVTFCFLCEVIGGELASNGEETLDLAWFSPSTLPKTSPWYQAMLDDWKKNEPSAFFQHGSPGVERIPVGYIRSIRPLIGNIPIILPGCIGFVQNERGEILLQQRSDSGLWSLPGGGMELGERLDFTLVKEVFEETGILVEPSTLVGAYSVREPIIFTNGDQIYTVLVLFRCHLLSGYPKPDGVETLDARFFPLNQLPTMTKGHIDWIQDALRQEPMAKF